MKINPKRTFTSPSLGARAKALGHVDVYNAIVDEALNWRSIDTTDWDMEWECAQGGAQRIGSSSQRNRLNEQITLESRAFVSIMWHLQ